MKTIAAVLVVMASMAALISLPPASAESYGAGTCREVTCPCSKEDEDKIKGLIGRLRALRQVADITRREFNAAETARDKARDSIGGPTGSSARYLTSLIGMATISPQAPNWAGWLNAGLGVYQSPNDWSSWANVGTESAGHYTFFTGQGQQMRAFEDALRSANLHSGSYYRETRDAVGAIKRWDQFMDGFDLPDPKTYNFGKDIETTGNIAGALLNVWSCIQATDDLVNDWSDYFEQRREAKQLQKQLDKIDEQIESILKELEELRKRCASRENDPGTPQGSFGSEVRSSKGLTKSPSGSPSSEEHGPDESGLRTLLDFQARLDRIEARFRDHLIIFLSPFMANAFWREIDPTLLWEISRRALPDLEALPKEIDEALAVGRRAHKELRF